jgi:hypothetical protein
VLAECARPERDRRSFRVFARLHDQPNALSLLRRIAFVSLANINVIEVLVHYLRAKLAQQVRLKGVCEPLDLCPVFKRARLFLFV